MLQYYSLRRFTMAELTLIIGPMYSGKTFTLIRELDVAGIAERRVLAIKPGMDTRTVGTIMSRRRDPNDHTQFTTYLQCPAYTIATREDFGTLIAQHQPEVLGIDELQFFEPWIVDEIFELTRKHPTIKIVASGLDADFTRTPFPVVAAFVPMATRIIKETAVCFACKGVGQYSQKMSGTAASVEVDAAMSTRLYEARCGKCHTIYHTE